MRRREFIAGFGAAATAPAFWSRAACAQHAASTVIGFLSGASPDGYSERLRGFRQGLQDAGFIEGTNISIDYRWAEGHADRLPALAADLVRRRVAVIAAPGSVDLALAAGSATKTVPIVFLVADDPVKLGLVTSVARPGGNLTGVNIVNAELAAKRFELLRLLVPGVSRVAVLVNPEDTGSGESTVRDSEFAARAVGVQVQVLKASSAREIDTALATFQRERPDALSIA